MDFVTISEQANAVDFGDMTHQEFTASVNSTTRGIYGLAHSNRSGNILEFITISTTGNATDFGDRTVATRFSYSNIKLYNSCSLCWRSCWRWSK